ncbi:hypothetical protein ACIHFD_36525 [Nonomuraea sp. NPDC051941]
MPNRRMTWVMYGEMVAGNPSYALRRVMGSTSSSRAGLAGLRRRPGWTPS